MEFDTSYLNTTPGKYKTSCLAFGAIGLLALLITDSGRVYEYNSTASTAFVTTLILLIILCCIPSLRSNQIWSWVELIITGILFIIYIVASIYIIKACWNILSGGHGGSFLKYFIGTLIASICSVFATLTYGADTLLKFREATGSSSTSNV